MTRHYKKTTLEERVLEHWYWYDVVSKLKKVFKIKWALQVCMISNGAKNSLQFHWFFRQFVITTVNEPYDFFGEILFLSDNVVWKIKVRKRENWLFEKISKKKDKQQRPTWQGLMKKIGLAFFLWLRTRRCLSYQILVRLG